MAIKIFGTLNSTIFLSNCYVRGSCFNKKLSKWDKLQIEKFHLISCTAYSGVQLRVGNSSEPSSSVVDPLSLISRLCCGHCAFSKWYFCYQILYSEFYSQCLGTRTGDAGKSANQNSALLSYNARPLTNQIACCSLLIL